MSNPDTFPDSPLDLEGGLVLEGPDARLTLTGVPGGLVVEFADWRSFWTVARSFRQFLPGIRLLRDTRNTGRGLPASARFAVRGAAFLDISLHPDQPFWRLTPLRFLFRRTTPAASRP